MRDFKVGDHIRYGALPDGAPIWNAGTRRTSHLNVEIIFKYGVVTTAGKEAFGVTFRDKPKYTWTWPQPSTNKVPAELWEDPNYIQLVDKTGEVVKAPKETNGGFRQERDQWRDQAKTLQVANSKMADELQALKGSLEDTSRWWKKDCGRYTKKIKALESLQVTNSGMMDILKEGLVASRADLASAEKVLGVCEDEIKQGKKRLKRALSLLGLR